MQKHDQAQGGMFPVDRANELQAIEEDYARIIAYRKSRSTQQIRDTRAWLRRAKNAPLPDQGQGRPGRP